MELDELKNAWQQSPIKNKINTDIMELIHHKSYGPIAALKAVFRKQIIFMAIIPFVLVLTNIQDVHVVFTSIMFWSYVAFCIGIIAFAYYNYRIASKMEMQDGLVKSNLEQQIHLLEHRASLEIIMLRCALLFFVALTEIVPYIQHYRTLYLWHSFPFAVRFGAYTALFLLQYFMNRRLKERRIGRHLDYLKKLVSEMQE
jgi:hypothetical protein